MQIVALRCFLSDRAAGRIAPEPIERPHANAPMRPEQKIFALERFPAWRAARVRAYAEADLHAACRTGGIAVAEALIEGDPSLIETRTPEGWTPLILAVHAENHALAEMLLRHGADPNATGRKGTTVLMYAKTPQMGRADPDTTILDRLIEAGAEPERRDKLGLTVLDYVEGDPALHGYFAGKGPT